MILIHCKQAVDFISKREELKLSRLEDMQLGLHLLICKGCKRFVKQNEIMIAALKKYAEKGIDKGLSDAEKERMITMMR